MSPKKPRAKKPRAKKPRVHYLISDFTPYEANQIIAHCKSKGISVSQFLGDTALTEISRATKEPPKDEEITITLRIPAEQNAKIKMFAHRQDKTVDQFVEELLLPTLKKAKTSFTSKTTTLHYYLSPQEHRAILRFLKERNLSARTYVAYLALEALNKEKRKKQSPPGPPDSSS